MPKTVSCIDSAMLLCEAASALNSSTEIEPSVLKSVAVKISRSFASRSSSSSMASGAKNFWERLRITLMGFMLSSETVGVESPLDDVVFDRADSFPGRSIIVFRTSRELAMERFVAKWSSIKSPRPFAFALSIRCVRCEPSGLMPARFLASSASCFLLIVSTRSCSWSNLSFSPAYREKSRDATRLSRHSRCSFIRARVSALWPKSGPTTLMTSIPSREVHEMISSSVLKLPISGPNFSCAPRGSKRSSVLVLPMVSTIGCSVPICLAAESSGGSHTATFRSHPKQPGTPRM